MFSPKALVNPARAKFAAENTHDDVKWKHFRRYWPFVFLNHVVILTFVVLNLFWEKKECVWVSYYFLILKCPIYPWWRHQMKTFSALLAICAGNSPVPGEFPAQRPVVRIFDDFLDLRLNKWLSKQLWGWWFEMLSCPLWRHCNVRIIPNGRQVPIYSP